MSGDLAQVSCGSDHCITCGDDGDPMTVIETDVGHGLCLCRDEQGALRTVDPALVDAVAAGDVVLVHAGVAIAMPTGGGRAA